MTSNMFAGEKRLSSTRRGAMTVLGKVAVPKPLNLPSQRLENHGLDPNAEIVPKGTINWGNRSAGNAWNSLASSPKSDGGGVFSSDAGAWPSPGGSGTRPSTATSDKGHEPVPSSCGSNSRPSSASGALSSNQSLTSLRPHSADTRPGSNSQLSRFAETLTDNSVALVSPGISDKLGGSSSTNDGFYLSSGDFPTLGAHKDHSRKNTDYKDNRPTLRPSSSSGMIASVKEKKTDASVGDACINANVRTGNVDTWRRSDSENFEDGGPKHSMNNWQGGEAYAYPNASMPPQLVGAWPGHQIQASSPGVWYRGHPGGPPYIPPPLGPGGFPLDPFPYYGPQIQTPVLAHTRPMPPNTRPMGHHPGKPDLFRPHIPDVYMHPSMPIRPGFYPSPIPYEGYYRPPMGFVSAKEHGMSPGPTPVYNMYSGEHLSDPGKEHTSAHAGCAVNSLGLEHWESGYQHDNNGQCRVLLKQHHETVGKEENNDCKQTASIVNKRGPDRTMEKNEVRTGRTDELGRNHKQDTSTWSVGSQKHDSDMSKSNIPVNFGLATKSKHSTSTTSQVSHVSTTPKPILLQKIEGLNAKTQACDSDTSIRGNFHESDKHLVGGDINPKATTFTESAIPRVPSQDIQGKLDHYGRRINSQGGDVWQKKPHTVESAHVISNSEDAVEKRRTNFSGNKVEGETLHAEFDNSNDEAQRAMLKEMVKERSKQLQKEEEERKREQKATALLKRSLPAADVLVQKVETPARHACANEQENRSTLNLISLKAQIPDSPEHKVPQPSEGSMSRHNKHIGHNKQKQNSTRGKIMSEKSSDAATHVKLEIPGSLNGFAAEAVIDESFHRKKNNRSGKMKPKVDDNTTAPTDSIEHSVGRKMMANVLESKPDPNTCIAIEEVNCKPPQRSQHPFPKHQHANRGSDSGAIWAPVRMVSEEETSGKKMISTDEISSGKSDSEGQNNPKSKRAEMKRYVPKPVAMGQAKQPLSSYDDQGGNCNDLPQYKQKKVHESWRQKEPTNAHTSYNVDPKPSDDHTRYPSESHRGDGHHHRDNSSQNEKGRKENHGGSSGVDGNASSSHWQPKSQPNSSHNNQLNRGSCGKNEDTSDTQKVKLSPMPHQQPSSYHRNGNRNNPHQYGNNSRFEYKPVTTSKKFEESGDNSSRNNKGKIMQ